MNKWRDAWMDGRMNKWMDGWMMERWIFEVQAKIFLKLFLICLNTLTVKGTVLDGCMDGQTDG